MSSCGQKYAYALADPFSQLAMGSCVPVVPATRSFKVSGFVRFTMKTGTDGYGFVQVMPTLAKDAPAFAYSSNSTVAYGSGFPGSANLSTSTQVSPAYFSNLPFGLSNFYGGTGSFAATTLNGRIVGVGVRLRYVGTQLNEGGMYHGYTDPSHADINGVTLATVESSQSAITQGLHKQFFGINLAPITTLETAYSTQQETVISNTADGALAAVYPYGPISHTAGGNHSFDTSVINGAATTWDCGNACMGILVYTAAASQTLWCEGVIHVEYTGTSAEFGTTESHASMKEYEMVVSAIEAARRRQAGLSQSNVKAAFNEELRRVSRDAHPLPFAGV